MSDTPMQRLLLTLACSFFAQPAFAADHPVNDVAGLRRAMAAVRPGDRVLIAPGTYRGNHYFKNVHGAEGKPILVMASDPERPPRFTADNACLHISGASHLELRGLHLGGCKDNALNIDDAGDPDKPAHHIVLKNLIISDVGPKGNVDGIKLSGVDDFQIVDCMIKRWGSGGSALDMVGCHRGELTGCSFKTGGANGVQMKGGAADIVVRKCRFEDCGERNLNIGGNTDVDSFRPPVKSMPANGRYEVKNITVEGCTLVGGSAAIACVGLDGGVLRYNTILRPEKYALRILQENTGEGFVPCRNVEFDRNIAVFNSRSWGGVNVGPNTDAASFTFSKNTWYCEDAPARSKPQLPVKESGAEYGSDPKLAKDRGADAFPKKN